MNSIGNFISICAFPMDCACQFIGRWLFKLSLPTELYTVYEEIGENSIVRLQRTAIKTGECFSIRKHLFWEYSSLKENERYTQYYRFIETRGSFTGIGEHEGALEIFFSMISGPLIERWSCRIDDKQLSERMESVFSKKVKLLFSKSHIDEGNPLGYSSPHVRWQKHHSILDGGLDYGGLGLNFLKVALCCAPGSWHAEIIIEGLEYKEALLDLIHYIGIVHLTVDPINNHVDLHMEQISPEKFRYSRKADEVWSVPTWKVNRMLDRIAAEKRENKVKYCFFSRNGENCFTWAKRHLKEDLSIDIEPLNDSYSFDPRTFTREPSEGCAIA